MDCEYRISKDLTVRPICEADTLDIVKWRANPRVKNNFLYQGEITEEDHLNWLHNKVETGEVEQFIICADERPIGSVYFRDIDNEKHTAEYGIFIGEDDSVGKGYGSDVAKWAAGYAQQEMLLKTLFLRVLADNRAAYRSYEKAGFKAYETVSNYMSGRDLVFMKIDFDFLFTERV